MAHYLEASCLNNMLSTQFTLQNGVVNAKGAYFWLMGKKALPPPQLEMKQCERTLIFDCSLSFYYSALNYTIQASGKGFKKVAAEQDAFYKGLQLISDLLPVDTVMEANLGYSLDVDDCDKRIAKDNSYTDDDDDSSSTTSNCFSAISGSASSATSAPDDALTTLASHPRHALSNFSNNQLQQFKLGATEANRLDRWLATATMSTPRMIVCLDVEKDERSSKLLEGGVDIWFPGLRKRFVRHYIVRENIGVINKHCPQNRNGFFHGKSDVVSETAMLSCFALILEFLKADLPFKTPSLLVGHTLHNDIKWLSTRATELKKGKNDELDLSLIGIEQLDIALVFREREPNFQNRGLKDIGGLMNIPFEGPPHNAGNDAVHTMKVFAALCKSARLC